MKLREQKRILLLLEKFAPYLEMTETPELSSKLLSYYTNEELQQIVLWLYGKDLSKSEISKSSRDSLIEHLNSNFGILLWTIENIKIGMSSIPQYEQKEIDSFFTSKQKEMHYLASKPVHAWDEYDKSNYRRLLISTGVTRRVYGIYSSSVKSEDVYDVTTKPSHYFDTQEEAQTEIDNLITNGKNSEGDLVVHSLRLLH